MLIPIDRLKESEDRFKSWNKKPGKNAPVRAAESLTAKFKKSAAIQSERTPDSKDIRRKQMIDRIRQEPTEFAYERAIGKNDSVYSNFVELITEAKRKVGRIVVKQGIKDVGFATGFIVGEGMLLTNWHVFKSKEEVAQSEVQFFYELDTLGNPGRTVSFRLDSDAFFYTYEELDYCLIAVEKTDITGTVDLSSIGYIFLDPTHGKLGTENEESLNIIHHPEGDYKQLSIRENLFTKMLEKTIWYESDTAQGSSGSPVFNDQWQVVALHHMGVPDKNKQGQYIDKNGKPILPEDGKIDSTRIHWIANEGVRISVILNHLFTEFPNSEYVGRLKVSPHEADNPSRGVSAIEQSPITQKNPSMNTSSDSVKIEFPASLIEQKGNISIHINYEGGSPRPNSTGTSMIGQGGSVDLEEIKKLEEALDFSNSKGYQPNFMDVNVPLPLPKPEMQKYAAKINGSGSTVLNYDYYSVVFHSIRKQPMISAINVDGDLDKRKDKSERKDSWLRDGRLDYSIQLDDKYYSGSGFDKGHMSRREDANWGDTAADAKKFADLTCMYTNACPQVAKINQSKKKGLWGKLEIAILEQGALKEQGKLGKISVFNGPIFKQGDPIFRGVQIPLEFYKIVLWLNDSKKLKATAFKLSQEKLVGDIDFEAIDVDENVEFKAYQCSIKSLQADTRIDFSRIIKYDTFKGATKAIKSEESLKAHIKGHKKK